MDSVGDALYSFSAHFIHCPIHFQMSPIQTQHQIGNCTPYYGATLSFACASLVLSRSKTMTKESGHLPSGVVNPRVNITPDRPTQQSSPQMAAREGTKEERQPLRSGTEVKPVYFVPSRSGSMGAANDVRKMGRRGWKRRPGGG